MSQHWVRISYIARKSAGWSSFSRTTTRICFRLSAQSRNSVGIEMHFVRSPLFIQMRLDTGNYRRRVLHKLAKDLELPKLTFQVIRRTIATLAQKKKGTVKDVQGLLRHSRAATTTDVYMQEIPESVQATVNAINAELRVKPEEIRADF